MRFTKQVLLSLTIRVTNRDYNISLLPEEGPRIFGRKYYQRTSGKPQAPPLKGRRSRPDKWYAWGVGQSTVMLGSSSLNDEDNRTGPILGGPIFFCRFNFKKYLNTF